MGKIRIKHLDEREFQLRVKKTEEKGLSQSIKVEGSQPFYATYPTKIPLAPHFQCLSSS